MTGWRRVVVVGGLVAMTLGGGVAAASHDGSYGSAKECIEASSFAGPGDAPSCARTGDGRWVRVHEDLRTLPGSGGLLVGMIVFALLWSAAPAVLSGMIASNRGQSLLPAVLLGLILGWIGLLIVYFVLKPEVTTAASNVVKTYGSPHSSSWPAGRDTGARLQELDLLKSQGLITDEEYDSRRAAILAEI